MRGPPATTLRRQLPHPIRPATIPDAGDVAIIGAGIVGLAIGWRLQRLGLRVAIFDRATAGAGASLAATGMLAAAAEFEPGGESHLALALASQAAWPGFAAELEAEAQAGIDYRRDGILLLAQSRDEVERLRFRHELQRRAGLATQWLDGLACRRLEPGLRPAVAAGIFCPDDHQVDPPRLLAALRRAFLGRGGSLSEGCPAETWLEGGRVAGVATPHGRCRAGIVVAACGAWTALPDRPLPLRPLKGQSLALRMDRPLLARMVWTEQVHLAPKGDGTLVVGATMEECGFNDSVTAGGIYALLDGAHRILPGIEELPVAAIWSGFRPTTADDAPILGETATPGLLLAAGHHRNGYLLAPVTAAAIVEQVTTGRITGPAAAFPLSRFATALETVA